MNQKSTVCPQCGVTTTTNAYGEPTSTCAVCGLEGNDKPENQEEVESK